MKEDRVTIISDDEHFASLASQMLHKDIERLGEDIDGLIARFMLGELSFEDVCAKCAELMEGP